MTAELDYARSRFARKSHLIAGSSTTMAGFAAWFRRSIAEPFSCRSKGARCSARNLQKTILKEDRYCATLIGAGTCLSAFRRSKRSGMSGTSPGSLCSRFRLLSTGGRDLTAIGGAIDRYRREIAATFNANFLTIGEGAGSYALDKNKTSFFILTLYTLLGGVRDTLQRFVFDRVFDLNSIPIALRPTLSHGKVAASSLEETATFLSSLAGFVQPRAELEDQLLRAADLPVPERVATNESDAGTPLAQQIGVGGTQSLVEIVRNVHERQIPAESGIKMIVALFGLPEDQAAAIVGEVSDEVKPNANA